MSVSKINENTGQNVKKVANPKLKQELKAGIDTQKNTHEKIS